MDRKIKAAQAMTGKTVERIAIELRRSTTYVSLVLNGHKPGYAIRPALARALNISESKLNRLLGGGPQKGVSHATRQPHPHGALQRLGPPSAALPPVPSRTCKDGYSRPRRMETGSDIPACDHSCRSALAWGSHGNGNAGCSVARDRLA